MRLPAGSKAALWLLFLVGCSARPVIPPINTLSHILDEHNEEVWNAFSNFDDDQQPPVQTSNNAAHYVSALAQPQMHRDGANWGGHGLGPASSSYNGWTDERSSTGLLDDIVALRAGPRFAGLQHQSSANYSPLTVNRNSAHPHTSVQPSPALRSDEPWVAEPHGYPRVGPPALEDRIRSNPSGIEEPASYLQLDHRKQPSSLMHSQEQTVQHDHDYEQGPPTQQSAGHASLMRQQALLELGSDLLTLSQRAEAFGNLLDHIDTEDVTRFEFRQTVSRQPSTFLAGEGVKAQFRRLLQQRLDVFFPGREANVAAIGPISTERNIYKSIGDRKNDLKKHAVAGLPLVYRFSNGQAFVGDVESGGIVNSYFWAGGWVVMPTLVLRSKAERLAPEQARIRAVALLPTPQGSWRIKGRPTALYLGDYKVPRYAAIASWAKMQSGTRKLASGP